MGRGIVPRKVQRNTVIKHFFENVLIFAVYGIDNFPYICYTFLGGENMDLIKIGKFIAELRKEQGLSQTQLGEKIGVTNKTVSRWETGTYLPPADMLLVLSEMFGVSINEMLCGKRLKDEEYKAAAEENLRFYTQSVFTVKERLEFFKKKWLKEHIAIMCCLGAVIIGLFLTGLILKQYFLTASSVLLFAVCHAWRNNAMMSYAEGKVFNEARGILKDNIK